ncbi:hypothetical protein Hanom_Chr07g00674681 [Helianthus anomalus]
MCRGQLLVTFVHAHFKRRLLTAQKITVLIISQSPKFYKSIIISTAYKTDTTSYLK